MKSSLINASGLEEAIVYKAKTMFPDVWELAISTEDENMFDDLWSRCTALVVDDLLATLIDEGQLEVHGMTEQGDMMFSLKKQTST